MEDVKILAFRDFRHWGLGKVWLETWYKGKMIDRRRMFGFLPTRFFEKRLQWRMRNMKKYAEILIRNCGY